MLQANQYDIYDINGKNRGTFTGIPNKHTLAKFITESHGSILVKRSHPNSGNFIKSINASQISSLVEKQIDLTIDSLHDENWLEVEKNEIIKICVDGPVVAWETSLNSSIVSDSCLAFQAPTLIGVDTLKAYFSQNNAPRKINLAIGMKYLNFKNEKILLGYNVNFESSNRQLNKEEDPERIVSVTATYLVDKYPVTNCEVTQLMWDSIPLNPSFSNKSYQKIAEQWKFRKENSVSNEKCIAHDSAACTVFLLQAMKYANVRSIREGLKPYYIFSTTDADEPKILFEGKYIIGNFNLKNDTNQLIQVTVNDSSNGYRLPYYDEWMMIARGGDKKNSAPWGDSSVSFEETAKYARFSTWKKYYQSEPVGQLQPNGYGLYDMFGLVWEHVLFENRNPFYYLKGRPSCLKGGDNHVKKNEENSFDMNPYWKLLNYGFKFSNYNGGMPAGFRLIRKLK